MIITLIESIQNRLQLRWLKAAPRAFVSCKHKVIKGYETRRSDIPTFDKVRTLRALRTVASI